MPRLAGVAAISLSRRCWVAALQIFRELDHPDQHQVERQLAGLVHELEV